MLLVQPLLKYNLPEKFIISNAIQNKVT